MKNPCSIEEQKPLDIRSKASTIFKDITIFFSPINTQYNEITKNFTTQKLLPIKNKCILFPQSHKNEEE